MKKKQLLAMLMLSTSLYAQANLETKLYLTLPDSCPVPDNLAVAPTGSLTLTCPNFKGGQKPVILSINTAKEVTTLAHIPGRKAGRLGVPMGLDYAPDGSLFVANAQGQVVRLTFDQQGLAKTEVIAQGIAANGLKYSNGYVYVTQPRMPKISDKHMVGGLYRFKATDRNIKVTKNKTDPHLIFTATTSNPARQVSLDGLAFDKEGNLYIAEFGDGTIYKLRLGENGAVEKQEVYAQLPITTGIDGILMDNSNNLYVTGFASNRLIRVKPDRTIELLSEYPDNDGANGELDQPVDVAIFDNKLIISNFGAMVAPDMVNKSHDQPYTLSYIDLQDL